MSDKWVLEHGIHRGTIISRDSGMPEEFDTEKAARKAFADHRKFYRSIGYRICFAYLTSPDGRKELLEQDNDYY